jgi:hypothetical protein
MTISFDRSFDVQVDYRCLVSFRGKETKRVIGDMTGALGDSSGTTLRARSHGSMATFSGFDRVGEVVYDQPIITPPIFHVDTIVAQPDATWPPRHVRYALLDQKAFLVWLQPWLHHEGKRGIFYSLPYDVRWGYGDLDLYPIDGFQPYQETECRDRVSVAVDAYLQAGRPDERFTNLTTTKEI